MGGVVTVKAAFWLLHMCYHSCLLCLLAQHKYDVKGADAGLKNYDGDNQALMAVTPLL